MVFHNNQPQLLENIRVLDLSRILAGPYCTQILGDYGADVIKIEHPEKGDDTRQWGPPFVKNNNDEDTDQSAYYICTNRNKRSFAVDIATKTGQDIIKKLVLSSDIFIENFKKGDMTKYQLDYDTLRQVNPRLIYCSITGFGQTGPYADKAGYDLMIQAFGGFMSITGHDEPTKAGVAIADIMCGMYALSAILAALYHCQQTGDGQYIDISLADTQIAWLVNQASNYLISGDIPKPQGNQHPNITPYQTFLCCDGHVVIAVGNDCQFQRFCDILNISAMSRDNRFSTNQQRITHRDALLAIIEPLILKWQKKELVIQCEKYKIPASIINNMQDIFNDPHVNARNMQLQMPYANAKNSKINMVANPVKFSKTPVVYRYAPPTCGQHNNEILDEFNLHEEKLNAKKSY